MISTEHLTKLYHVPLKEAAIIRAVLGCKTEHKIKEISRKTGLPRTEVEKIIFSNSSCETIQIIRQFVTL